MGLHFLSNYCQNWPCTTFSGSIYISERHSLNQLMHVAAPRLQQRAVKHNIQDKANFVWGRLFLNCLLIFFDAKYLLVCLFNIIIIMIVCWIESFLQHWGHITVVGPPNQHFWNHQCLGKNNNLVFQATVLKTYGRVGSVFFYELKLQL